MTVFTEDQALDRLRDLVTYDVNISQLAKRFDVSAAFMSMVLKGQKGITAPMLEAIGLERKTVYTEREAKADE